MPMSKSKQAELQTSSKISILNIRGKYNLIKCAKQPKIWTKIGTLEWGQKHQTHDYSN